LECRLSTKFWVVVFVPYWLADNYMLLATAVRRYFSYVISDVSADLSLFVFQHFFQFLLRRTRLPTLLVIGAAATFPPPPVIFCQVEVSHI
jgi:hypothetical protein